MEPQIQNKTKEAHVTLGIDEQPPVSKVVPAGETKVSVLKNELGVDPTAVLYLVHGKERRVLDDSETLDVESGMHFEAIGGGKAS
jgi:hypothetical protein